MFVNAANTIRVPGYRVADALVEYAVNTHLSLRMNVYNLTDAVYIRNVNNNGGTLQPWESPVDGAHLTRVVLRIRER